MKLSLAVCLLVPGLLLAQTNPAIGTVAVKRINSNTFESTQKRAGKAVGTARTAISKAGQAMTFTKGTNAKGEAVNNVTAWEKQ